MQAGQQLSDALLQVGEGPGVPEGELARRQDRFLPGPPVLQPAARSSNSQQDDSREDARDDTSDELSLGVVPEFCHISDYWVDAS